MHTPLATFTPTGARLVKIAALSALLLLILGGAALAPARAQAISPALVPTDTPDAIRSVNTSSFSPAQIAAHFNATFLNTLETSITPSLPAPPSLPEAIDSVWQQIAEFNNSGSYDVSVTNLAPGKFVVAYRDGGNSFYGTARLGQVIGGIITYGPEAVFNTGNTGYIAIDSLTQSSVIVAYSDWGNSNYGTAVKGNISGDTISFGSEYVFNADTTGGVSVSMLGYEKFIVAYQDTGNANHGAAVVGTHTATSGNSALVFGSEYEFNSDTTSFISVNCFIWVGNRFVVAYRDINDSNRGRTRIGDVSGYSITYGAEDLFNSATGDISVAALSSFKFVVVYRDESSSNYGSAKIGDVSGTDTTFGGEYIFDAGQSYIYSSFGVDRLSDTSLIVGYRLANNDGRTTLANVSGTIITFETPERYNPGYQSERPAVAGLNGDFVVCWSDISHANRGKCRFNGGSILFLPLVRN